MDSTLIWDDGKSGANHDFSCYAPSSDSSSRMFVIGHFGIRDQQNGRKPRTYVVSLAGDADVNSVFQHPLSYSIIWTDAGSGATKDGSFWKVNCPDGYGSLSDLCQVGHKSPNLDAVWCIKKDYLEDDERDVLIWDDTNSGAQKNVDINGGQYEHRTMDLVAATTERGTTKTLKRIKMEYLGI